MDKAYKKIINAKIKFYDSYGDKMTYIHHKKIIAFLLFGVAMFAALVLFGDYQKIYESLFSISPATFFLLFILTTFNYALRFLKWDYLLKTLNIKINAKTSILIFLSGLAMAITPAKAGEFLKSQLLKDKTGLQRRNSVMVIFFERLTDIIGLSLLSLIGLSAFFIQGWPLIVIFFFLLSAIFIFSNEKSFFKTLSFLSFVPFIKSKYEIISESYLNSKSLFSAKVFALSSVISVFSWMFECLAFYTILSDLGTGISITGAIFIFSFSSIFGSVLVLPGGMGASEGSMVALLLFAGASKAAASLSTIIIRATTLWFGVLLGLLSLAWLAKMKNHGRESHKTF